MTKEWKQKTWFRAEDGTKGSNALVAKEAGVTVGTVYNVFNCPEKVIPETTNKVLEAVKKLKYIPNELPTMKMCTTCKVVKPPEDFYDGYKSKNQRYSTNKRYPHSRCKECDHVKNKAYIKINRAKVTKQQMVRHREREYGVTEEQYNNMILSQNNLCAICSQPSTRTLNVDHDHETGKVRALLCINCNLGIGNFQDSLVYLQNAVDYLNHHAAD